MQFKTNGSLYKYNIISLLIAFLISRPNSLYNFVRFEYVDLNLHFNGSCFFSRFINLVLQFRLLFELLIEGKNSFFDVKK